MEDNRIQNQIAIYMTNKKLCEFTDKLKPAPIEYYMDLFTRVFGITREQLTNGPLPVVKLEVQ